MNHSPLRVILLLLVYACLFGLHALPVPPLLLTVTHVNPVRFGILPVDQDTGDEDGALVFNILAVYMPLECMEKPDGLNCGNLEIFSPASEQAVTQLALEVDPRFGPYGLCNICVHGRDPFDPSRTCVNGTYTCNCQPWSTSGRRLGSTPANAECSTPVGHHEIRHEKTEPCNASQTDYQCWWRHLLRKIGGHWYSTPSQGLCDATHTHGNCTWRVRQVLHRISKACSDNIVNQAIEDVNPGCFRRCGRRNTTSPCWIR
eukprot:EG_transcript_23927